MSENTGEATTAIEKGHAAEDSEREATGGAAPKIFMVPIEGGDGIQMVLPKRWKRAKFLKQMSSGNPWGAFEAIWPPVPVYKVDDEGEEVRDDDGNLVPELDRDGEPETETHPELAKLEEVEMDEDEFQLLMERLGETLMGRKPPKGKASRR